MIFPTNYKIKTFLPPVVIVSPPLGKIFVCPGWIDITDKAVGKSIDEIQLELDEKWRRIDPLKSIYKPKYEIKEMVTSSKGDKQYEVTFNGTNWNCSCVGFGFRRTCKHCESVKKLHKNSKN